LCGSNTQAPIDIDPDNAIPACLPPLVLENWDHSYSDVTLINIFRAGALLFDDSCLISLSGGPLPLKSKYYLVTVVAHVGADDTRGSDNSISGQNWPIEIGIIFSTNPNTDLNLLFSADNTDGLAVVMIHGEISKRDNPAWKTVIDGLKQIRDGGTSTQIPLESLSSLLPRNWEQEQYYSYVTSISLPPCTTNVVRIVVPKPFQISSRQLLEFRYLYDELGLPIVDNFRPKQSNKNRQVLVAGGPALPPPPPSKY